MKWKEMWSIGTFMKKNTKFWKWVQKTKKETMESNDKQWCGFFTATNEETPFFE